MHKYLNVDIRDNRKIVFGVELPIINEEWLVNSIRFCLYICIRRFEQK